MVVVSVVFLAAAAAYAKVLKLLRGWEEEEDGEDRWALTDTELGSLGTGEGEEGGLCVTEEEAPLLLLLGEKLDVLLCFVIDEGEEGESTF